MSSLAQKLSESLNQVQVLSAFSDDQKAVLRREILSKLEEMEMNY